MFFNVAFLPNYTGVKIRISLVKESSFSNDLISFQNIVTKKIKKYVYGFDNDKIQDIVINKMIDEFLNRVCFTIEQIR